MWKTLHSFSVSSRAQRHRTGIESADGNASSSMDIHAQAKLDFIDCLTSDKKQASNPSYEVEPKCVNGKCYDGQSKTDD